MLLGVCGANSYAALAEARASAGLLINYDYDSNSIVIPAGIQADYELYTSASVSDFAPGTAEAYARLSGPCYTRIAYAYASASDPNDVSVNTGKTECTCCDSEHLLYVEASVDDSPYTMGRAHAYAKIIW